MTWLDHRIPPPAIALALVPVCWGLASLMPRVEVPPTLRIGLTVAIAAAGLGISAAGTIAFRRARTTVNPLHPERASALVTGGIYRRTRNPMYVGMLLGLVSWVVYLGSAPALLGPVAFVLYITRFQILPEEQALEARFGADYRNYQLRVRRWL